MREIVSCSYATFGRTAAGYSVDVTYRCVGAPHQFLYGAWRGLLLEEAHELLEAALYVLQPGAVAPSVVAQLPLEVWVIEGGEL